MVEVFLLCAFLLVGLVQARLMFDVLNASAAFYNRDLLNNQHIVFVGDSLLRYQYLSLIYFAHFGRFYPANSSPNILVHVTFKDWVEFYEGTNSIFAPHEHCDCFRKNGSVLVEDIYENRYYYHKQRNISISYIQYFGDSAEAHGHWAPGDKESNHGYHGPDHEARPYRWRYSTVQETLTNIAAKLEPKPSVLLLNAGHWPNNWGEESHRHSVLSLALSLFPRVIWKTTNYRSDGKPGECAHEEACAFPGVECMDIGWTKYLTSAEYTDFAHFQPAIYTDLNIQFILQLIKKEPLSVAPMNAHMHGHVVECKELKFVVDSRGILRLLRAVPEIDQKQACSSINSTRPHVHLPAGILLKHLLGEPVQNLCTFVG